MKHNITERYPTIVTCLLHSMDVTFPEMLRGKFDFLAHDEVLFEFKICVSTGCFDVGVFFLSLHPSQEILSTFMTYILCPGNIEIIRLFLHHGMDINESIRGNVSSFIPFGKTVYTATATRIVLVDLEKQVLDLFICHGSELYVDPDITRGTVSCFPWTWRRSVSLSI